MARPLPKKYHNLLEDIQGLDFTIMELNLYLDTHPDDKEAYEQLQATAEKVRELKKVFEENYGPLQLFGSNPLNQKDWTWSTSPWPWQV
ncbi:MAG TPA: spore coat protein CotJB [Bacillus sp. (in: firmicutes)]|nr:spore coat protein CotJB [Bacillus sp. (in: firmicutes)]